jgi:HAE1 family hydrophobic/amphiphilic exporter-1
VEGQEREDIQIADLMDLRIPSPSGGRARVSDVATVEAREVMPSITRRNQQYSRTVGWSFQGPLEMARSVEAEVKAATVLPAGYEFEEFQGYELSLFQRRQLELLLLLAVGLVFMLTAALYESLFQPFTVILTIPLALIGVFAGYALFNRTFDEAAYMGLILVGGIVVNNTIILVDQIHRLRRRHPRREAVIRAAQERLRPILMTMFTTVLGLLPLVLWSDSGQALWSTMAFTLCVALPVATLFTLSIIPLTYEGTDTAQKAFRRGIGALVIEFGRPRGTDPSSAGPPRWRY